MKSLVEHLYILYLPIFVYSFLVYFSDTFEVQNFWTPFLWKRFINYCLDFWKIVDRTNITQYNTER